MMIFGEWRQWHYGIGYRGTHSKTPEQLIEFMKHLGMWPQTHLAELKGSRR